MTCREFEQRLDAGAPLSDEAARHVDSCAACRELEEIARVSQSVAPPTSDALDMLDMLDMLTRDVMARTTGSVCEAAGDRIIDMVDGVLDGFERDLVVSHLKGCPSCDATAAALGWMRSELSSMAAIDPGEEFTAAVLRATRPMQAVQHAEPHEPWWLRLWERPRFTWEAAYVGAMVLWLLFGAAFSPFRDVPGRALEIARSSPVQPASMGREIWQATGGALMEKTRTSTPGLNRLKEVGEASSSLASHGTQALGSAIRGDLSGSAVRLKDMGGDLKRIYDGLTRRETQPATKPQEA